MSNSLNLLKCVFCDFGNEIKEERREKEERRVRKEEGRNLFIAYFGGVLSVELRASALPLS